MQLLVDGVAVDDVVIYKIWTRIFVVVIIISVIIRFLISLFHIDHPIRSEAGGFHRQWRCL